jgi:hypothetical protein
MKRPPGPSPKVSAFYKTVSSSPHFGCCALHFHSFWLFVVSDNMRFNTAFTTALVSSASLMGYAHAEEETADTTVIEKPVFTVCN